MKPPYAIGSVPSLSGHAIAYRWRSLPRVRRHGPVNLKVVPKRVLPWQITMDQLIFASLSHTHYWYEVGMLKVPARLGDPGLCLGRLIEFHVFGEFLSVLSCLSNVLFWQSRVPHEVITVQRRPLASATISYCPSYYRNYRSLGTHTLD